MASDSTPSTTYIFLLLPTSTSSISLSSDFSLGTCERQPMKSSRTAPPRTSLGPCRPWIVPPLRPRSRAEGLGFHGRNPGWEGESASETQALRPGAPYPYPYPVSLPSRERDAGAPGHGLPYPMCTEGLHEVSIGRGVAIRSASGCVHVAQLP